MCNCALDPNHDPAQCECSCHYKRVPSMPSIKHAVRVQGCENCRKTERNLAKAIGIIERLADADRVLANLQTAVTEQTEIARQRRIEAARWLEELT